MSLNYSKKYSRCFFNCEMIGYEIDEKFLKNHLKIEMPKIVNDTEGTELLVDHFKYLNTTGFTSERLTKIFELDQIEDYPHWKYGEEIAKKFLIDIFNTRFHWDDRRDQKNQSSNPNGADIVGFMLDNSNTKFAFGEVKTSNDKNVPPKVVYGRRGLTNQLENMKTNKKIIEQLIRYVGFKVVNLERTNPFHIDYENSLINYENNNENVIIIGILIRDTTPDEKDLKNQQLLKNIFKGVVYGLELYNMFKKTRKGESINGEGRK